jgi:hypothetical protein
MGGKRIAGHGWRLRVCSCVRGIVERWVRGRSPCAGGRNQGLFPRRPLPGGRDGVRVGAAPISADSKSLLIWRRAIPRTIPWTSTRKRSPSEPHGD